MKDRQQSAREVGEATSAAVSGVEKKEQEVEKEVEKQVGVSDRYDRGKTAARKLICNCDFFGGLYLQRAAVLRARCRASTRDEHE